MGGRLFGRIVNSNTLFDLNPRLFAGSGEDFKDLIPTAEECFSYTQRPISDATDVGYIPPIIFQLKDIETKETYMITLFDYAGEAIFNDDDKAYKGTADKVRFNSDGIIFMFDAGVTLFREELLPDAYKKNYNENDARSMSSIAQLLRTIRNSKFSGESITKPVAMVLTKSDYIKECEKKLHGIVWPKPGIPEFLTQPEDHDKLMVANVYECHKEIKQFLDHCKKEGNLSLAVDELTNGDVAWFGVSSTGIAIDDGTIPKNAAVTGVRECDPLEWLLYRNGQIEAKYSENDSEVENWLLSVQPKNCAEIAKVERELGNPDNPDPNSLIGQYKRAHEAYMKSI